MARNKTTQDGISLRSRVTAWLATILLVTMLSTGIATMAGQWTVRSFDMLLADNAVCYTVQNALFARSTGLCALCAPAYF